MVSLQQVINGIKPLDEKAMGLAQRRWNTIAKPLGSLGLLEETIIQIAGMTNDHQVCLDKRCVVVMCADNGVVEEGVTQTSSEVTAVVTENFTKGETSVNNMANIAHAKVIPVDIGVARDVEGEGLIHQKIAYGTKNMTKGPAMTREEAIKAVEAGIHIAVRLKEEGYRIIATGEMGIGNTTTSSAITSVFLHKSPEEVTGRGAGLSSEGLKRKIDVISKAIEINNPNPNDPLDVLSKVGGLDIAGLTGVFLGGAFCELPVVIDGFISAAAALCAVRICPQVKGYLLPSHVSNEPAGTLLMSALELEPFLHAKMCLGEGSGAVAIFPILDMACAVYNNMSTFSDIQIEEYQPLE